MSIELVCPFPESELHLAWEWMNEFPSYNMDDYGPKDFAEFREGMVKRMRGEIVCGVTYKDALVGIIGFAPITARFGMFHGICFSRAVHGKHICSKAVRTFMAKLFSIGVEKIGATYFADNRRVRRFLLSLGAKDEGYLSRQTVRKGKPVDTYLVAFFKESSCL